MRWKRTEPSVILSVFMAGKLQEKPGLGRVFLWYTQGAG